MYVNLDARIRGYIMTCVRCGHSQNSGATHRFHWDVEDSRQDLTATFEDTVLENMNCDKCKCNTFRVVAKIEVNIGKGE